MLTVFQTVCKLCSEIFAVRANSKFKLVGAAVSILVNVANVYYLYGRQGGEKVTAINKPVEGVYEMLYRSRKPEKEL